MNRANLTLGRGISTALALLAFTIPLAACGCAAIGQGQKVNTVEKAALAGVFLCEARASQGSGEQVADFVRTLASSLRLTLGKDGGYSLFRRDTPDSTGGYEVVRGSWALAKDTLTLSPVKATGSLSFLNYDLTKKLTLAVVGKDANELKCFGPKTSETDPSTLETWFRRKES